MVNTVGGGGVAGLVQLHSQKIAEQTPIETKVPGWGSPEKIREQAVSSQKTGGVLADHAVSLQKLADDKKVVICIRAVNPLATGLIESGFGTKDMSIKAKSSNLPPLNGLIPFDQTFGKKGNDAKAVEVFTHKNEVAIEEGVATKVPARIPADHIKMLARETGNLEVRGTFLDTPGESGVMIGTDFKTKSNPGGQQFAFWGENVDGQVSIFKAVLQENGSYAKGEPVEVMANRDGVAVTADYDLAMVAPRMQDYGPQHTSDLKVASFKEYEQLTGIVGQMEGKLAKLIESGDREGALALVGDAKLLDGFPDIKGEALTKAATAAGEKFFMSGVFTALDKSSVEYGGLSQTEIRTRVQDEVVGLLVENLGKEAVTQMIKDDPDVLAAYCDQYAEAHHKDLVARGVLPDNPSVSRGVTSNFVNDLLQPLNDTCGRKKGTEVFHHGADTGNPFSVEADNFPMTVILPREAAGPGGEVIRIIGGPKEFTALVKDLKNAGFQTPLNALWDGDPTLATTRSERFDSAMASMEKLMGSGRVGTTEPESKSEPEAMDMLAKRRFFENFQNQKV